MSPKRHLKLSTRLWILVAIFILLSAVTAYGSTVQLSSSDAQQLSHQVSSIQPTTKNIFLNNVEIALQEEIPGYGLVFSIFTSYQTGVALSAIAETSTQGQVSGLESFFLLLLTPIYWLEFFSYSLAVEESISVVASFILRDFTREEWKWLIGSTVTVVVVLLVSASLEASFVTFFR